MKQVFDEHYKQRYIDSGLIPDGKLQHLISDAATMQIIRWTKGVWCALMHFELPFCFNLYLLPSLFFTPSRPSDLFSFLSSSYVQYHPLIYNPLIYSVSLTQHITHSLSRPFSLHLYILFFLSLSQSHTQQIYAHAQFSVCRVSEWPPTTTMAICWQTKSLRLRIVLLSTKYFCVVVFCINTQHCFKSKCYSLCWWMIAGITGASLAGVYHFESDWQKRRRHYDQGVRGLAWNGK